MNPTLIHESTIDLMCDRLLSGSRDDLGLQRFTALYPVLQTQDWYGGIKMSQI